MFNGKFFNVGGGRDFEIHLDAAGFAKPIRLTHRLWNHEDVAEQNRGVKTEAADRLQRDFRREFGRLDELQKRIFLLELAIFRQRAPSLPHEPDWRTIHRLATRGGEETLAIRQRGRGGFGRFGGNGGHFRLQNKLKFSRRRASFLPQFSRNFVRAAVFNFETMKKDPIQNELRGLLSRKWNFIFNWRAFLPRAAVATAAVLFAGLTLQHHEVNVHRAALAKNVALVAEAPMPDMDALKNFDAIRRMSQPARPDEELLALMK